MYTYGMATKQIYRDNIPTKIKKISIVILGVSFTNSILYFLLFLFHALVWNSNTNIVDRMLPPLAILGYIVSGVLIGKWLKGTTGDKILYGIVTAILSIPFVTLGTVVIVGILIGMAFTT